MTRRLPRWFAVVFGLLTAAVGGFLMLSPFASLNALVLLVITGMAVLGLLELFGAREADLPGASMVAGIGWLLGGAALAIWPGVTMRMLAFAVGVGLIIHGLIRVVAGVRGTTDQRVTVIVAGLAALAFGGLALSWPGVTLLVIGLAFGAWLLFIGLGAVLRPAKPVHLRWPKTVGALAALVLALAFGAVGAQLHNARPRPDAFYDPPASLPAKPGVLLRSEPYDRGIPAGSHAWRILYTSTRDDRTPATASGIVVVSDSAPAGPRPVIAWAHGTTGIVPGCAPSVLAASTAGAMPAIAQVLAKGWVLVATDYVGLGTDAPHPYLIGQGEARSVLDAVRAARQLHEVQLSDQTVVWGHSQGGHAALWTGALAPAYAPDAHVIAVAALAPASDLSALVGNLASVRGGAVFASYVVRAYEQAYPDVRLADVIRPAARVQVREIAGRCLAEPEAYVSFLSSLVFDKTVWNSDPTAGALGERLRENTPTGPIAAALLIAQGENDPLVTTSAQSAYALALCHAGQPVEYRKYPGRDHLGLVAADSPLIPDLLRWTQDRLDGRPHVATC